ncbi:bifunctional tetrahydrofolate synthase/dihydrofolate synthase [Pseudomonas sp. OIL-1]|uniref:bifunctional tetrahydrofolate synthase/dihydrofolate synthase n=1 Tax=Pseudomonas sp. OIL-1 TaxID=2706126 RepID=UPI0013A77424|nr:bifunctional tetrahydrofolate synthase/dihydrofolate synthase [Pseudomonas sp. OIL-1]QIB52049.1 bifunctional tetrahydrofolate synthase/dihydrofolate synthase [Pseudomonas sp. OIL-1]
MTPRSLTEWLTRLEGLHPKEIDMGLARVSRVASQLDVLRPASLVFTVTGTNGKGSTCAALASLLHQAGMRAGCYTSPHLVRYNERISIAGQLATDDQLCLAFEAVEQARGEVSLTYFEFGTLAALWLFKDAELDAVVLEVGLGGRLDAVNVVDANVAVVTSIGLDHQEYLGDTRELVGYEKAGILRQGRSVVCGEIDLPASFIGEVNRLNANLLQRGSQFDWSHTTDGRWSLYGLDCKSQSRTLTDLPAVRLPRDNLAVAIQAFWAAGLDLSDTLSAQALRDAYVPGRVEWRTVSWLGQPRRVCLDVGHNPHAAAFLGASLQQRPVTRHAIFGLLSDKDLPGVVEPLSGLFESWAVTPLPSPRSRSAEELAEHLIARGERAELFQSVADALRDALDNTPATTEIVIFGSFFCVADAILWLSEHTQELTDGSRP